MATPGSGQTDWIMGVACNEVGEINYMFMRKSRLVCCCPNNLVDFGCMHSDHVVLFFSLRLQQTTTSVVTFRWK